VRRGPFYAEEMDERPVASEGPDPDPDHDPLDAPQRRRRGRRTGGGDTREQILAAARAEFVERGYVAASIRGIARRADVDPALVRYWFEGGKAELLSSSLMHPNVNPARIVETAYAGPLETLGERLVTVVLKLWDFPGGPERFRLIFQAAVGGQDAGAVRDYLAQEVFAKAATRLPGPNAALRVNLAAAHISGLMLARYVMCLEPLASASAEDVVRLVGPTIQRYFDPRDPDPRDPDPRESDVRDSAPRDPDPRGATPNVPDPTS
jgi:AcrR family transcriptional regulator